MEKNQNKIKEESSIFKLIKNFLKKNKCPNCGKLIDSIIVGNSGIRCEFCRGNNHLDQISLAAKIDSEAVKIIDFIGSVSKGYPETIDKNGKIIDSPALKFHLSKDLFDGDLKKFIKDYVSMFVICKRDIAKLIMPDANTFKTKVSLAVKKEDKK